MRKRPFVKAGQGMLLGYARVSKGDEQSNALQAKALRAAGCCRIFEETASGGRWDRPELRRAMIPERTSAGLAAARAEGRIGGRRKKLDPAKRREIAESVISGRKTGAEMARLYNVSAPTVSRIVAQHRTSPA